MSYKEWFLAHSVKHALVVDRLINLGYSDDEIIGYFEYENMRQNEHDFCPLYASGEKCHESEYLNCYLCACPNFRFSDVGMGQSDGCTIYSECSINSKDGRLQKFGDNLHQDCSNCLVPHARECIKRLFNKNWAFVMRECDVDVKQK